MAGHEPPPPTLDAATSRASGDLRTRTRFARAFPAIRPSASLSTRSTAGRSVPRRSARKIGALALKSLDQYAPDRRRWPARWDCRRPRPNLATARPRRGQADARAGRGLSDRFRGRVRPPARCRGGRPQCECRSGGGRGRPPGTCRLSSASASSLSRGNCIGAACARSTCSSRRSQGARWRVRTGFASLFPRSSVPRRSPPSPRAAQRSNGG